MKSWLPAVTALLFSVTAIAGPSAGRQYAEVLSSGPSVVDDKIEVVEFFWYGCPHCYRAEPHVENWLKTKADDVRFVRVPMVLNKNAVEHTKIFYTAESLGVLDRIHPAMFNAMQKQRRAMTSKREIAALFAQVGIDEARFSSVFDSFEVDSKMRATMELSSRWGINSVPTMIVDGQYRTSGSMAGTYPAMMGVVDFLVDQARDKRKAAAVAASDPARAVSTAAPTAKTAVDSAVDAAMPAVPNPPQGAPVFRPLGQ